MNPPEKQPFDADDVCQVIVRLATSDAALVDDREMPAICLQHMVAVMLLDKAVSFRAAHDKLRMEDANVRRVRAAVQLVPDQQLETRLPRREATVTVVLADGTQLTEHVDAVRGTAENPMTRAEVVAKSRDLMSPILGRAHCEDLIDQVLALETVTNVQGLRPLLQRA